MTTAVLILKEYVNRSQKSERRANSRQKLKESTKQFRYWNIFGSTSHSGLEWIFYIKFRPDSYELKMVIPEIFLKSINIEVIAKNVDIRTLTNLNVRPSRAAITLHPTDVTRCSVGIHNQWDLAQIKLHCIRLTLHSIILKLCDIIISNATSALQRQY